MRRITLLWRMMFVLAMAGFFVPSTAAEISSGKPVVIVVGFPAAGISNGLARLLGLSLGKTLGRQVIVENRPGAGTTIAAAFVAKSAPDGDTLFMQDMTTHAINASLYRTLPYDPIKDFTPISLVASSALVLMTHPSLPAKSVKQLIAYAKTRPNEITYGSSGVGTILHLAGEMFQKQAWIRLVHVPYKSGILAQQGIMGGEVAMAFGTMPPLVDYINQGRLRALAVTSRERVPVIPTVPTMAEAGLPGFEIILYSGMLGPRGMPKQMVDRLNNEIVTAVKSPEAQRYYKTVSVNPLTSTPEEFSSYISSEIARLAAVVRDIGVSAK